MFGNQLNQYHVLRALRRGNGDRHHGRSIPGR